MLFTISTKDLSCDISVDSLTLYPQPKSRPKWTVVTYLGATKLALSAHGEQMVRSSKISKRSGSPVSFNFSGEEHKNECNCLHPGNSYGV